METLPVDLFRGIIKYLPYLDYIQFSLVDKKTKKILDHEKERIATMYFLQIRLYTDDTHDNIVWNAYKQYTSQSFWLRFIISPRKIPRLFKNMDIKQSSHRWLPAIWIKFPTYHD
jgi:hypothetical protein